MSRALIIDTETTGLDEPQLLQAAYLGPIETPMDTSQYDLNSDGFHLEQFCPSKDIELGAMATHHILASDVVGCPPAPEKWLPKPVVAAPDIEYLVGHNIDFDWRVIGSPNVKRICTLALARGLFPDLGSHSLVALLYALRSNRADTRKHVRLAHHAGRDCIHVAVVLWHMILDMQNRGHPCNTWDELWRVSEIARVPVRMWFGKFGPKDGRPGRPIKECWQEDRRYMDWAIRDLGKDWDAYQMKGIVDARPA